MVEHRQSAAEADGRDARVDVDGKAWFKGDGEPDWLGHVVFAVHDTSATA